MQGSENILPVHLLHKLSAIITSFSQKFASELIGLQGRCKKCVQFWVCCACCKVYYAPGCTALHCIGMVAEYGAMHCTHRALQEAQSAPQFHDK